MLTCSRSYQDSKMTVWWCWKETLNARDVPTDFRDIGILHGYRKPGSSFRTCLQSMFKLHNETFNVWTHLIFSSLFLYLLCTQPHELLAADGYTLFCLLITCVLYPLGSATAHLFNCMSPVARHICFMIDYLSISLYAFGACCSNKVYALPDSWQGGLFADLFLVCMFVCCMGCVYVSCSTRFMPVCRRTKILRLSAFALPYIIGMTPCMHRVIFCSEADNTCVGASYYAQHFFDTIFTVTFYGGHVPEVLFPGYFDIFFQSHSIFHVVVAIGSYHHSQGIMMNMTSRPVSNRSPMSISPIYPLALLTILNSLIVIHFGRRMAKLKRTTSGLHLVMNNNEHKDK